MKVARHAQALNPLRVESELGANRARKLAHPEGVSAACGATVSSGRTVGSAGFCGLSFFACFVPLPLPVLIQSFQLPAIAMVEGAI